MRGNVLCEIERKGRRLLINEIYTYILIDRDIRI
jgi:hypothetical protein